MSGTCHHCRQHERLVGPCHFNCGWLCQVCFDAMIELAMLAQAGEKARRQ